MTDRPIKILIALQYYLPHRTGLTLHVQRVAEALASRGHHVTVLTARYDTKLPRDEAVVNGVRVVRLWAPIKVSRGKIMPAYPWAAWNLVRQHDVVSIHTPMLETAVFGIYCWLLRKGLIITHHGDLVLPSGFFNRIIEHLVFGFYRVAGRVAHHILAYSSDYARHSYYIAPFRDKAVSVHPPIVIPEFDLDAARKLHNIWLAGRDPKAGIIGFAGRFVEEKRPDILIQALETVHKKHPSSLIVFAGQYDIKYEDFYERNLDLIEANKEHLIFLGLLENPQELANVYGAMDVLALPSDTECFALVQVEAMRNGTPVVSTNIPGARIVVQKTGMGEIVPPHDPLAMGEAISRILDTPEKYKKPAQLIDQIFNFEKTIDLYERYLRDAAEKLKDGHKKR
jgi:glycosyltransferase involved in cell wall biosynthesis